jgi:hypothetical protein
MPTKVPVQQGGTQLTSIPTGSILATQSTNVLSPITSTSGVKYLKNDNGVISWDTVNFDTSNLVPYTGATADVDLNNHYLTTGPIIVTGGRTNEGHIVLNGGSNNWITANASSSGLTLGLEPNPFDDPGMQIAYDGGIYIYARSDNYVYISNADYGVNLDTSKLTTDKTIAFPDSSGTFALAENVVPYSGAVSDLDLGAHSLTIDTNLLYVDSINDAIGIGTIPSNKLDIDGEIRLRPSSQPIYDNGVIYYDSTANKFKFYQNGAWVELGSGNVIGPSSSTDNNIVLFDGTTGTLIKDSGKTLPSGAIVGTSDTQTLQNKTLDNTNAITIKDANLIIQNSSDTTKQAKFDASGISASTTRTYTLPDANTTLVGTDVAQTLTNKRINPRVYSTTSTSSLTPDANSYDRIDITALANALTINNPSGTPVNFQQLIIRIKDNGTAQTISWGSAYESVGATLPTTTTAGKWVYIGLIYNSSASQWQCVAVAQQS